MARLPAARAAPPGRPAARCVEEPFDAEAAARWCPPFTLQPLVENAIRHGVSCARLRAGASRGSTQARDGRLALRVDDDGPGCAAEWSSAPGLGLGVPLRERLAASYARRRALRPSRRRRAPGSPRRRAAPARRGESSRAHRGRRASARLRLLRDLMAEVPWLECVGEVARRTAAACERSWQHRSGPCSSSTCSFRARSAPTWPRALGRAARRSCSRPRTTGTAVTAFELHALDYLLKPSRPRARFPGGRAARERWSAPRPPGRGGQAAWSACSCATAGRIVLVPDAGIERLEAQDDYVAVHLRDARTSST